MRDCENQTPERLIQGIEEYHQGLYFECHETLEALWLEVQAPVRELYQGILQVSVALYKQGQGNYRGTANLLRRSLVHLAPVAPVCQGVDVARLIWEVEGLLAAVLALGPERIGELAPASVPRVHLVHDDGAG